MSRPRSPSYFHTASSARLEETLPEVVLTSRWNNEESTAAALESALDEGCTEGVVVMEAKRQAARDSRSGHS